MKKEFNLSDKIEDCSEDGIYPKEENVLYVKDVKEFIEELKEELCLGCKGKGCSNCRRIDKLAGEDLK